MSDYLQYVYLASDALHIRLILDLIFLQDLNGDVLPRVYVCAKTNFSKGALTQGPTYYAT